MTSSQPTSNEDREDDDELQTVLRDTPWLAILIPLGISIAVIIAMLIIAFRG